MKKIVLFLLTAVLLTGCSSGGTVKELESKVQQLEELNQKLATELMRYYSSDAIKEIASGNFDYENNFDFLNDITEAVDTTEERETENIIDKKDEMVLEIIKNQSVTVEDFCEAEVVGVKTERVIEPPNASGRYHYFEAGDGEVYVDITINMKNLSSSSTMNDEFAKVTVIYDDKYEYRTSTAFEEKDGQDLSSYASIYSTDPLKTTTLHYLAALPEEILENEKPLSAQININGITYMLYIR